MDFGVAADLSNRKQSALPSIMVNCRMCRNYFLISQTFTHEAIFISHLHIDHMGALQYLKKPIPIYLSEPSYKLYQLLIKLGIEKPVANLHPLAYEQPITIGDLTVTGFHSDHDEPGVMAL